MKAREKEFRRWRVKAIITFISTSFDFNFLSLVHLLTEIKGRHFINSASVRLISLMNKSFCMIWVFFCRILFSLEDLYVAPWHERGGREALTRVLHERRFLFRDDIQDTCPVKGDFSEQTFKMSGATKGPKCSLELDFLKIPRGMQCSSACYKGNVDTWAKLEL